MKNIWFYLTSKWDCFKHVNTVLSKGLENKKRLNVKSEKYEFHKNKTKKTTSFLIYIIAVQRFLKNGSMQPSARSLRLQSKETIISISSIIVPVCWDDINRAQNDDNTPPECIPNKTFVSVSLGDIHSYNGLQTMSLMTNWSVTLPVSWYFSLPFSDITWFICTATSSLACFA